MSVFGTVYKSLQRGTDQGHAARLCTAPFGSVAAQERACTMTVHWLFCGCVVLHLAYRFGSCNPRTCLSIPSISATGTALVGARYFNGPSSTSVKIFQTFRPSTLTITSQHRRRSSKAFGPVRRRGDLRYWPTLFEQRSTAGRHEAYCNAGFFAFVKE